MAKTNLKAVKDDRVFCELTLDQINEVNQKIHFVLSTLDILRSVDTEIELNIESLITLAYEAHDKLTEAKEILNRKGKQTALPDAPGCV